MKSKIKDLRRISLQLFTLALFFTGFFLFIQSNQEKSINKPSNMDEYYLYLDGPDGFNINFQNNLDEIVHKIGVSDSLQLLLTAQKNKKINSSHCHNLSHLIGHLAWTEKTENLKIITKNHAGLCTTGFMHGIEAQIVLEENDMKIRHEKLEKVCSSYEDTIPCYHGVGHAYYQLTKNVQKSLSGCETLKSAKKNIQDCYIGVFGEFSHAILGIDSETGLPRPDKREKFEYQDQPLLYCVLLKEVYQNACYSMLSTLSLRQMTEPDDFSPCLFNSYSEKAKEKCITFFAEATTDTLMLNEKTLNVPQLIINSPENLQIAYINGLKRPVNIYEKDTILAIKKSVCSSFSDKINKYCTEKI